MSKYYFREEDDELCSTLPSHYDYMRENGLKELTVFEAKRELDSGYFFCTEHYQSGMVGEGCGKMCEDYKPRNGKNGRCKFSNHTYECTDVVKILTLHNESL